MNAMKVFTYASDQPFDGNVYSDNNKLFGYDVCWKCDGVGELWYHRNVKEGVCFACGGEKKRRVRLYTERENASQRRRIEKNIALENARRHVTAEINTLRSIKEAVQNGFRNIARLHANAVSSHVGEVGQRIDIEATMTFCMGFDGFYGTTYINTFTDAAGNIYLYRGNKLANKGEAISLKATVKEHGEYKGAKQTVVNRPKLAK